MRKLSAKFLYLVILSCGCSKSGTQVTTPVAENAHGPSDPVAANAPADPNTPIASLKLPAMSEAAPSSPAGVAQLPGDPLYAETGDEEILDANLAPPGTPLRARKGDAFFRLAKARFERDMFRPSQLLVVDYERRIEGNVQELGMMIRTPDGVSEVVRLSRMGNQRTGTISISSGFGPFNQFPRDAEMYLVNSDSRYELKPRFKVSNSVTIGNLQGVSLARNWTSLEREALRKPPPPPKLYMIPKLQPPTEGEDTDLAGSEGGVRMWFLDPSKAMLGFDYRMGSWENEPSPAGLVAIFSSDQPAQPAHSRMMAREGYVVAGMTVSVSRFANALKLLFARLKPDGNVDLGDFYESDWIGKAIPTGTEIRVGGDGRRAIGFYCNRGAVHNAIGLILADPIGRAKLPRNPNLKPVGGEAATVPSKEGSKSPTKPAASGVESRYTDPQKRPLLGIECRMTSVSGEPNPSTLTPLFDRSRPESRTRIRALAKEGYAVGGISVSSKQLVNAIKLTFMKVRADGSLDPRDSYESDWLGTPLLEGKVVRSGGDGRKVLGYTTTRQGGISSVNLISE